MAKRDTVNKKTIINKTTLRVRPDVDQIDPGPIKVRLTIDA